MENKIINTFSGGLNTDVSINKYQNNNYYYARNLRLTSNDSLTTGALTNLPAPASILTGVIASTGLIMGITTVRDTVVLFFRETSTGASHIYKKEYSSTQYTLVYSDASSTSKLSFNTSYPIYAIGRYESPTIQKVYWCDYYNENRYINIAADNSGKEAYLFSNNPYSELDSPVISEVLSGGSLYSGSICYAYQLYSKNGAETAISSTSIMIPLSSRLGAAFEDFRGDELEVNTGNAVRLFFDNLDANYDRIRIYSIHYTSGDLDPIISVVAESDYSSSSLEFNFIDKGTNILQSLTTAEYIVLGGRIFASKTLETKNNYLFAGNIKEFNDDVTFDARTYRFKREIDPSITGVVSEMHGTYVGGVYRAYITVTFSKRFTVSGPVTMKIGTGAGRPIEQDYTNTTTVDYDYTFLQPDPDAESHPYIAPWDIGTTYTEGEIVLYDSGSGDELYISAGNGNIGNLPTSIFWHSYVQLGDTVALDIPVSNVTCNVYSSSGTPLVVTAANWTTVPETHDCINYFNNFDNDLNVEYIGEARSNYEYMYKSDGTTLGGEGPNISYTFVTKAIEGNTITTSGSSKRYIGDDAKSFTNPILAGTYKGYKRGEVYRFGIQFIFKNGSKSFVKWIGDIRMPFIEDYELNTTTGSYIYNNQLGVQFSVDLSNLSAGDRSKISGYNIVRVERESPDKNIICQGLGGALIVNVDTAFVTSRAGATALGYANHRIPESSEIYALLKDNIAPYTDQTINPNFYELNSPEISFSTENIIFNATDKLCIVGGQSRRRDQSHIYDSYQHMSHEIINLADTFKVRREYTDIDNYKLSSVYQDPDTAAGNFEGSAIYYRSFCGNGNVSIKNKCGLLHVDPFSLSGVVNSEGEILILEYIRNRFNTQYGGNTYLDRKLNSYIPVVNVFSTSTNTSSTFITLTYHNAHDVSDVLTFNVFGGDTYVCYFDLLRDAYDNSIIATTYTSQNYISFPVETSINLEYRRDEFLKYLTFYDTVTPAHPSYYLQNTLVAGIEMYPSDYPSEDMTDLYLYTQAYNRDFVVITNTEVPFDFQEEDIFDTMIIVSNKKTNGEYSDSWLKYNYNNFLEVDSSYGQLTALVNFNNKLLYFQEDAHGVLAVEDRVTVPDSNNNILSLGTGPELERFDYISTAYGAVRQAAIKVTDDSLYFVDEQNKTIRTLGGEETSNLGKLLGISNLLKRLLPSTYIEIGFDPDNKELLIALDTTCLVLNTLTNKFIGEYDMISHPSSTLSTGYHRIGKFVEVRDKLNFAYITPTTAWLSMAQCNYAATSLGSTSEVTLLIHPNGNDIFRFDVLDLRVNSFDNFTESLPATLEDNTDTVSQIVYRNSYISPITVNLTVDTNIKRIVRVWRTKVPLTTNDKRFVDTYLMSTLKFDNTTNHKYVLHDITTSVSHTVV